MENNELRFKKKIRGRNYSPQEEEILIRLVEDFKEVIENKKSDAVTWRDKERTWNKIANLFAARSGTARDSKALREKYETMKRRSKVELADEKREIYRTGGGVAENCVSTLSKQIAAMLGDSATGMTNMLDSDKSMQKLLEPLTLRNFDLTALHSFLAICEPNDFATGTDQEQVIEKNVFVTGTDQEQVSEKNVFVTFTDQEQEICDITHTKDARQFTWDTWNPKELKEPKSKRLCVGVKRKRTLEETKVELTLSQKKFYEEENRRAEEKHKEEIRHAEERHQEEITTARLRNELLQLELIKKRKEIND